MPQYSFGAGTLVGVRTDVSNPTPSQFGVLQEIEIDFDITLKELMGQYQSAVAIGRSGMKVTGKAKSARIVAAVFNDLFFGQTSATGGIDQVVNEAASVPAVSTYTVTVVNSATWQTDLGVYYASTGLPFKRVASAPAAGQYAVSAGVYTFAAADASAAVLISYTYTLASGATKITIANQLSGVAPTFQMNLGETFNGKILNLQLNACMSSKLTFPFKNSDFTISDFEFQAFADASNTIGYLTTTE